uniref:WGS project CBMI000000000 data, contig CS3069_c003650 n=1 Tax=Fusarium clavum TaxID=2594811 RepID=A0A090ME38_9HYPO|nr:unnamed protein product [Fusarium clavum]
MICASIINLAVIATLLSGAEAGPCRPTSTAITSVAETTSTFAADTLATSIASTTVVTFTNTATTSLEDTTTTTEAETTTTDLEDITTTEQNLLQPQRQSAFKPSCSSTQASTIAPVTLHLGSVRGIQ